MRLIILAMAFCLTEFLLSGFINGLGSAMGLSFMGAEMSPEPGMGNLADTAIGNPTLRIITLQALSEIIAVFAVIKLGRWPQLWTVVAAVLVSVLVWATLYWVLRPEQGLTPFKLAWIIGVIPIFFGSILAWLMLYKWLELKA